ncbi:MAG: hypothetical protein ABSB35_02250 [Bryobacteraceae bacterium]|jgi:hypothetical protein
MKLRFHGGTLRLRLSQSEVARLAEGGQVEEAVTFAPGQVLSYALEAGSSADVTATLRDNRIRVTIPADRATSWAESDETGIQSSKGTLRILIEKDFQCAHPQGEEDADAFPNPRA